MSFGICEMSLVPMRREPSHRSELVSQILFGEHYEVVESQKEWFKIRTSHDGYEGFIALNQHTEISYNDFQFLQKKTEHLFALTWCKFYYTTIKFRL